MQKAKWPNLVSIRNPALDLSKLLREVSAFGAALSDDSYLALGFTCSLLHEATHDTIQTVIMTQLDHLQCVPAKSYSSLRLVVIFSEHRVTHRLSHNGKGRRMLLSLEVEDCGSCISFFLPPSNNMQKLSDEDHELYEDVLSRFARTINVVATQAGAQTLRAIGRWSGMTRIDLSVSDFHAVAVSHLVKAHWPRLTFVNLINCGLDDAAIAELSLSEWPELQSLYLGKNRISSAGIALLVEGRWPCLETLDLEKTVLDVAATRCLCTGQWPSLSWLTVTFADSDLRGPLLRLLRQAYPYLETVYTYVYLA